ncbi:hypothetical protein I7I53_06517 [Histoplasma capsulatum var. duboisii H88]|uniref:Uncharacterized protein n=1 Tax=Ajellomyces capsulatus (strain H88) TaxID=544711 RepID=A0A8A1LCB5_AJEC8|nr:hypothetical protein I7I53_06517 [Histoplasma capsulatum var. duboisii H88]
MGWRGSTRSDHRTRSGSLISLVLMRCSICQPRFNSATCSRPVSVLRVGRSKTENRTEAEVILFI